MVCYVPDYFLARSSNLWTGSATAPRQEIVRHITAYETKIYWFYFYFWLD